jgi:hypothetical protein
MTRRFERIWRQMNLTERYLQTVEAVFHARYLTARMVQQLFYRLTTASLCRQRLCYLYDAGYLAKRRAHPNEPDIYFLGLMDYQTRNNRGSTRGDRPDASL